MKILFSLEVALSSLPNTSIPSIVWLVAGSTSVRIPPVTLQTLRPAKTIEPSGIVVLMPISSSEAKEIALTILSVKVSPIKELPLIVLFVAIIWKV